MYKVHETDQFLSNYILKIIVVLSVCLLQNTLFATVVASPWAEIIGLQTAVIIQVDVFPLPCFDCDFINSLFQCYKYSEEEIWLSTH